MKKSLSRQKIEPQRKILETPRLVIKEFTASDSKFIKRLLNTPGWLKYVGTRNINTEEDALKYIDKLARSYRDFGFGFYLVEAKDTGKPVGMCGLAKRETLDDVDIGYALLEEEEGKGYALEAAEAVMLYAKNTLGLKKLCAITVSYHHRSVKLLEKLGMEFERNIRQPNDEEELMLFVKDL